MLQITHKTTTLVKFYVASKGVCWKIKGLNFTGILIKILVFV